MKDKLRRLWVFHEWELEQQQAWLSDLAAQGWHLKSPRPGLASFLRGEPARMRYRCEIAAEENPEQIELYQAAGWEYVGRRANVLIFRAPMDDQIPEIHTDSREQALTLRLLKRNLWISLAGAAIWFMAIICGLRCPQFVSSQLLSADWLDLVGVLFVVHIFFQYLRGMFHLARLAGKLRQGRPLEHSVPYQQVLRRRQLIVPVTLLLAVLVITGSIVPRLFGVQATGFPPIPGGELPMARLSQLLEQAGYTEYRTSLSGAFLAERVGGDVYNYYRVRSSLLVPVQQQLGEKLDVPGVAASDEPTYSPLLITRRYEARTPGLARLLATQLAAREESDLFYMANLQPAVLPGADGFWRRDIDGSHAFILLKGNLVIDVFYSGLEPIEQLIDLQLAKLLTQP